ncbi:hypothetical protein ACWEO2_05005 [Nocardia sp. NPDC004278]
MNQRWVWLEGELAGRVVPILPDDADIAMARREFEHTGYGRGVAADAYSAAVGGRSRNPAVGPSDAARATHDCEHRFASVGELSAAMSHQTMDSL